MTDPFTKWYEELISDERWFETMQIQHRGKMEQFKNVASIVYGDAVSKGMLFERIPIEEHRRHIHYKMVKAPFDIVKPEKQEESKVDYNVNPLTDEQKKKVDELLEDYKKSLKSFNAKRVPKLTHEEIMQEGDWLPKPKEKYTPPDPNKLSFQNRIRKSGQEFYRGKVVTGFEIWIIEGFDVLAKTKEDAEQIYLNAISIEDFNQEKE